MTRQSCERNLQINKINTDFLKYIKTIKISMCNVQNFFSNMIRLLKKVKEMCLALCGWF